MVTILPDRPARYNQSRLRLHARAVDGTKKTTRPSTERRRPGTAVENSHSNPFDPRTRRAFFNRSKKNGIRSNAEIRHYFKPIESDGQQEKWLEAPEVPTADELREKESSIYVNAEIRASHQFGPHTSQYHYLRTLNVLLRDDTTRPIGQLLARVRDNPSGSEANFENSAGLYCNVHICGITTSFRGIATKVTFSLGRVGKFVRWRQSKRLLAGSIVLLSPSEDMFEKKVIVATVAARKIEGLEMDPPEIDLFFALPDEQEIDPAAEFFMIEHRGSLWEAHRYTLTAMQKMTQERLPLYKHLIEVDSHVGTPQYLLDNPCLDLSTLFSSENLHSNTNHDVLNNWPQNIDCGLEPTQLAVLGHMLTKNLAIVQGPPGTGKTHISIEFVKIFVKNWKRGDPPLIVSSQTNHALDQLLLHISKFAPDFVRLGSRYKEKSIIGPRSLYELKRTTRPKFPQNSFSRSATNKLRELIPQIKEKLAPLSDHGNALNPYVLQKYNLLTEVQVKSLSTNTTRWADEDDSTVQEVQCAFQQWTGKSLVTVAPKQIAEKLMFEYEDMDLEYEQPLDEEAEVEDKEGEFDQLGGDLHALADNWTCHSPIGNNLATIKAALKAQDMRKIPTWLRPTIYQYLQNSLKKAILVELREMIKEYNDLCAKKRIGRLERDELLLREVKIIGMTTSGLSRNRALISALKPRIVLIEEAAEIMEPPTTAACMPSVQQLVLVGDHKQLRAQCNMRECEELYNLNKSMFERLINNGVEYMALTEQRRMIPEIRRLLGPIYGNLITDHPSMINPRVRPDVPGMRGINSFFFNHQFEERRDNTMSLLNQKEAEMIIGFVKHLMYNGLGADEITILTFYNGQRKYILRQFQNEEVLQKFRFKVATVDSYQGKENEVVVLSMVRSNDRGQIGFTGLENRVCVALSRAKCGLYIFGNASLLFSANETWREVLRIMANHRDATAKPPPREPFCRVDQALQVVCTTHENISAISSPEGWHGTMGGCRATCGQIRACGHACDLLCHPWGCGGSSCGDCGRVAADIVAATWREQEGQREPLIPLTPPQSKPDEEMGSPGREMSLLENQDDFLNGPGLERLSLWDPLEPSRLSESGYVGSGFG